MQHTHGRQLVGAQTGAWVKRDCVGCLTSEQPRQNIKTPTERIHGVVDVNFSLLDQQDRPGVEAVVGEEDGKATFAMDRELGQRRRQREQGGARGTCRMRVS